MWTDLIHTRHLRLLPITALRVATLIEQAAVNVCLLEVFKVQLVAGKFTLASFDYLDPQMDKFVV